MLQDGLTASSETKQDWHTPMGQESERDVTAASAPLLDFLAVARRDLVGCIYQGRSLLQRARAGFANEAVDRPDRYNIPIAQMGNYSQAFQRQKVRAVGLM